MKIFNLSESVKKYYLYTEIVFLSLFTCANLMLLVEVLARFFSYDIPFFLIILVAVAFFQAISVLNADYAAVGIAINIFFYLALFSLPLFGFIINNTKLKYRVIHLSLILMVAIQLFTFLWCVYDIFVHGFGV